MCEVGSGFNSDKLRFLKTRKVVFLLCLQQQNELEQSMSHWSDRAPVLSYILSSQFFSLFLERVTILMVHAFNFSDHIPRSF